MATQVESPQNHHQISQQKSITLPLFNENV